MRTRLVISLADLLLDFLCGLVDPSNDSRELTVSTVPELAAALMQDPSRVHDLPLIGTRDSEAGMALAEKQCLSDALV
jgi:hypothetical protein